MDEKLNLKFKLYPNNKIIEIKLFKNEPIGTERFILIFPRNGDIVYRVNEHVSYM